MQPWAGKPRKSGVRRSPLWYQAQLTKRKYEKTMLNTKTSKQKDKNIGQNTKSREKHKQQRPGQYRRSPWITRRIHTLLPGSWIERRINMSIYTYVKERGTRAERVRRAEEKLGKKAEGHEGERTWYIWEDLTCVEKTKEARKWPPQN